MIDHKANTIVKKDITQTGRAKDTDLALFGKVAKEVELLKKGMLR